MTSGNVLTLAASLKQPPLPTSLPPPWLIHAWPFFLTPEEEPFTCSEYVDSPGPVYLLWGVNFRLPLPFPIFDLVVQCSSSDHFDTDEQLFTQTAFSLLPCNGITNEEYSCYLNSSLPGNYWHRSIICLHCRRFFPATFAAFTLSKFGRFVILIFAYFIVKILLSL